MNFIRSIIFSFLVLSGVLASEIHAMDKKNPTFQDSLATDADLKVKVKKLERKRIEKRKCDNLLYPGVKGDKAELDAQTYIKEVGPSIIDSEIKKRNKAFYWAVGSSLATASAVVGTYFAIQSNQPKLSTPSFWTAVASGTTAFFNWRTFVFSSSCKTQEQQKFVISEALKARIDAKKAKIKDAKEKLDVKQSCSFYQK